MTAKCVICGLDNWPSHRLFRLPHALRDLGYEVADCDAWAAAGCVNEKTEAQRRAMIKRGLQDAARVDRTRYRRYK